MALTPEKIKRMDTLTGLKTKTSNESRLEELRQIANGGEPNESAYQRNVVEPLKSFSKGFVKGGIETVQNIGKLGLEAITLGKADTNKLGIKEETLQPANKAESIGKGTERVAEFFVPAGRVAKLERGVDLLIKGQGFLKASGRILAKGGIEATTAGVIRTAQTGDVKEGVKTGLTAGIVRGGLGVVGETARAFKIPERLYSTIFKNTYDDVVSDFKSGAISELRTSNPARYDELVEKGIVKVKNGEPILNETLAKEALDRGLRGSIPNMAKQVVNKTLDLEDEARTLAKNYNKPIPFNEKQFVTVLNRIKTDFADVGLGETANEANHFLNALKKGKGTLSADDTLKFKRFLDHMRIKSSFQALPPSRLSQTQQNFKSLADLARVRLKTAIPEMAKTMDDYRFHIEALDALAREAKRRGNNQVISLIDSVFLGGGLASGEPVATGALLAIRNIFKSSRGATMIGQVLANPTTRPLGVALRALTGGVVSEATND